ncbi:hypothetical protein CKN80_02390 [Carnobacterium divergens]|uniref:WxL domain-containing protein n=1 Tax=Carnobacterium divergens TaxID=2748 RepID=UPI0010716D86|nr:WxL domain-containing protein [Carnobacterium divergens]TFJ46610.1 hypothetical protein CKN79_02390 [Carnobacterium divergens]TFJ53573.1 hypothetical protein CKN80_02390 [Carnobacterium divergens]
MKLTKLAVVGLMATTVLGSTVPALAASEVGTPATSKGAVNFQEGGGETTPTDPGNNGEDGGTIVKPDPSNPGGAGFLRIDQAPDLDFGTMAIAGKTIINPVKDVKVNFKNESTGEFTDGKYYPAYVQITDERSGDYKGWTLTAKATEFKAFTQTGEVAPEGTEGLVGAQLIFSTAFVQTNSGVKDELKPVSKAVTVEAKDDDKDHTILGASAGKGGGQWSAFFTKDATEVPVKSDTQGTSEGIQLSVPASAKKNKDYNYVADLTWTISATPDA